MEFPVFSKRHLQQQQAAASASPQTLHHAPVRTLARPARRKIAGEPATAPRQERRGGTRGAITPPSPADHTNPSSAQSSAHASRAQLAMKLHTPEDGGIIGQATRH